MHEKIIEALRRGAHEEAQALAHSAIEADPADARSHRLMAQALRLAGDHDGAMESIDRAVAITPDDSDLHFFRASVLLGSRDVAQALQALDQTLELDPNQLGAYLIKAQLALGSGDVDEAERCAVIAARIAPEHPILQSVQALVALGRKDKPRALSLATAALEAAPQEPEVLNAAAFVYLANGNLAFAEQTVRRLLELRPEHHALRRMLAGLLLRQNRPADALDEIEPLLAMPDQATPEAQRFAGELALQLGQHERALPWLRSALGAMPADPRALELAMRAWSQLGAIEDARNALEVLLSTSPHLGRLWRVRFSLETDLVPAGAVVDRWLEALPEAADAHEAKARLHTLAGDADAAEAALRKALEVAPDHLSAQGRLLDFLAARDPGEAVEFVKSLAQRATGIPQQQWEVHRWLGRAHDLAGDHVNAVQAWSEAHARVDPNGERLFAVPELTDAKARRVPAAAVPGEAPALAFLIGLPGSGVASVARLLDNVVPVFLSDRMGARPPLDPFQAFAAALRLTDGSLGPVTAVEQWRQTLPARGLSADGPVIDWLPHWDNALLDVIGAHLPQAQLWIAVRDPRDMLLDWLSSGGHLPLRMGSPEAAARWLALALAHMAELSERSLHPHVLLRLDDHVNSPRAMAGHVTDALGLSLPEPPEHLFGSRRYPAGHWRAYAAPLAEAFAELTPVAVRLGYPQD
ncbi:tetratricopeptide repeat protein [Luteimonas sp. MJ293]|uniref:tetratricopeptide repeat protein n=1 Tax=Luteimonas sp. MJ146 TaxID=3129240 RepID=UPI0031BB4DEA